MGIRSQAVLQLGPAPKNQEKCFNIIFLIPTPPPFFLVVVGWSQEPGSLLSQKHVQNQMLSSKSAEKSQEDYRSQNPFFLHNHLTHSTLLAAQSQGSVIRLQELQRGKETGSHQSDHSAGLRIMCLSLRGRLYLGLRIPTAKQLFGYTADTVC